TSGGVLDACTSLGVLKLDNVGNGNANQSGSILVSEALPGSSPPGCTVTGVATLTRIPLRAAGHRTTPLTFVPFNGTSGSRLYRTQPSVPELAVQFFDSGALLDVRR